MANGNGDNSAFLWKIFGGVIGAAAFTMLLFIYQEVNRHFQFQVDHLHAHEKEELDCASYRETMRRELDLLWYEVRGYRAPDTEGP